MRRRSLSSEFRYEVLSPLPAAAAPVWPDSPLPIDNTLLDMELKLLTLLYKDKMETHEVARQLDIRFSHFQAIKGKALLKLARAGANIHCPQAILEFIEDNIEVPRRQALVESGAKLVRAIAGKIARSHPRSSMDELISSGTMGLVDAARRYVPGGNTKFLTFAERRVRGAMIDDLREASLYTRGHFDLIKAVRKIYEAHRRDNSQLPREEMVPLIVQQIQALKEAGKYKGVNPNDENIHYALDRIDGVVTEFTEPAIDAHQERILIERERASSVHEALKHAPLNDRQRKVVELYYFEELTFREIGGRLGFNESRASQLHGRAIEKLHKYFSQAQQPRQSFVLAAEPVAKPVIVLPKAATPTALRVVTLSPPVPAIEQAVVPAVVEPPAPVAEETPAPAIEREHVARVTRRQFYALYLLHIERLSKDDARRVLRINQKQFDSAVALAATKLVAIGIDPKSRSQIRTFLDNPEMVYASKPVLTL